MEHKAPAQHGFCLQCNAYVPIRFIKAEVVTMQSGKPQDFSGVEIQCCEFDHKITQFGTLQPVRGLII